MDVRRCTPWLLSACASCSLGEHLSPRPWSQALHAQIERPAQASLELGLLGATAATAVFDHRWQQESNEDQTITQGDTAKGDAVGLGLGVLATGVAVGEWIDGDHGHGTEVLFESFLATEGVTEVLKYTVRRQRPGKQSADSFPSGHTSFAFAMATFVQRRIADLDDGWVGDLGYLAYLPAAYVGIDRSEANRHWPSDVAFGAFVGVLLTNLVYDAHYGGPGQPGLFGVRGLTVEPSVGSLGGEAGDGLELGAGLLVVWRH